MNFDLVDSEIRKMDSQNFKSIIPWIFEDEGVTITEYSIEDEYKYMYDDTSSESYEYDSLFENYFEDLIVNRPA